MLTPKQMKKIIKILQKATAELKEENDKWEEENGYKQNQTA